MNKLKKYVLGGIVLSIIIVLILLWLYKKYTLSYSEESKKLEKSYFMHTDTVYANEEWLSKEFSREMMKGVNGDFTLEQVDSMRKSWDKLDSIEASKR